MTNLRVEDLHGEEALDADALSAHSGGSTAIKRAELTIKVAERGSKIAGSNDVDSLGFAVDLGMTEGAASWYDSGPTLPVPPKR